MSVVYTDIPFVFTLRFLSDVLKNKISSAIIFIASGCGAAGSVLPWGGRGRPFKSGHSDQNRSFHSVLSQSDGCDFFIGGIPPLDAKF